MRIRVAHKTTYTYDSPAKSVIQSLRLTPRSHDGQHVIRWRIYIDQDARLSSSEDAFGNINHVFTAVGSIDSLSVSVEGEVETHDRSGILYGSVERFPLALYLRETTLAATTPELTRFAREAVKGETTPLARCHALMQALHDVLTFDEAPEALASDAGTAFAARGGIAQDFAHIFVSAARALNLPARYVNGLLYSAESEGVGRGGHAWAEAFIEGFGWIGFDPVLNQCPEDCHIRVAAGLDYLSAAPVRGARFGGEGELLDVTMNLTETLAQRQAQRQTQS